MVDSGGGEKKSGGVESGIAATDMVDGLQVRLQFLSFIARSGTKPAAKLTAEQVERMWRACLGDDAARDGRRFPLES